MFTPPLLFLSILIAGPEQRALDYLAREVPRWSPENKCYSCHHNGDAARALYRGVSLGYAVPRRALEDTTRWLSEPEKWDTNGGDGPFNDKELARLQFTLALSEATETKYIKDRKLALKAAEALVRQQHKDGSWPAGSTSNIGAPATYGTALATTLGRVFLKRTEDRQFAEAIERADAWLRKGEVNNVLDAAAVLWGLADAKDAAALVQRELCMKRIRKGASKDSGWGPYVNSGPEVFDTAIVVLALSNAPQTDETKALLKQGRAYLCQEQQKDGSWRETTRPSGSESYPNRLSTSAWATMALLATRPAMAGEKR